MPSVGTLFVRIISAHCQAWWAMGGNLVMYSQVFGRQSGSAAADKLFCSRTSQPLLSDLCHRNTRFIRSRTLVSMEKGISLSNRLLSELRILISIAEEPSNGFITDRHTLQKYWVILEFERWMLIHSIAHVCLPSGCIKCASVSERSSRHRLWI
jgi:hypothetical protein